MVSVKIKFVCIDVKLRYKLQFIVYAVRKKKIKNFKNRIVSQAKRKRPIRLTIPLIHPSIHPTIIFNAYHPAGANPRARSPQRKPHTQRSYIFSMLKPRNVPTVRPEH